MAPRYSGQMGRYQVTNQRAPGQGPRQNQQQPNYTVRTEDIKQDLTAGVGRPEWIFSAYSPLRDLPRQLFGGPQREISMEEMRLRHYQAVASGNMNQAIQEAEALYQESVRQMDVALKDLNGAAKYIADGANEHPNRIDIVAGNTSANQGQAPTSGQSAFGQPSAPNQSSNAFGNASSGWGNRAAPGQQSAFGQPSTFGQSSAFGQPSSLGQGSAFGQPSPMGQGSAFGKPSSLGQGSSAFGQPSSLGQGSAFGQPSNMGGQSAFGKPGFGQPSLVKPANNQGGFGQSAFGQPSAPAGAGFSGAAAPSSPFGGMNQQNQQNRPSPFGTQPANPSPFGQGAVQQPAAPSSFGQPSAPSGFGQPSQNPSPFAQPQQPQQPQPQNPNPFGQPSAPAAANPFGAPQQPAAAFAQPATAQAPVVNTDVGPPAFMQIDDPNEMNPLPPLNGETRRDASNRLILWKGLRVTYDADNHPCYVHPQDNTTLVRINFPNGAPDPKVFRDSQGKEEEYTPEITQAYQYFLANGRWKDGIVPAVPPKREWVSFDF